VDHFYPIDIYPEKTFLWKNMLWSCGLCNRRKLARFPIDENGEPLIVNPTIRDPWSVLTLDTDTGVVSSRYIGGEIEFSPIGDATLEVFETINYEAVSEGRLRVIRRYLSIFEEIAKEGDGRRNREVLSNLVHQDDFDLASWFALWEGEAERLPSNAREAAPELWKKFQCWAYSARGRHYPA
jgi:hypothetical protein